MSKFDIAKFSAEIGKRRGGLKTNKFRLIIPPPVSLLNSTNISSINTEASGLHFWASDVQLPGYQLMPGNVRRHTYGTNETRPFAPNFQQMQANFIMDGEATNWKFFSAWLQTIIPHDQQTTIIQSSEYGQGNVYHLEYKNNYATDLILEMFADDGRKVLQLNIREAFPSNLNPIPLSWGDRDNYAAFSVFFEYLDFSAKGTTDFKRAAATTFT